MDETIEVDAEVVHPEHDGTPTDELSTMGAISKSNQREGVIELASRIGEMVSAMKTIRRVIMTLALPGDWVRFRGPNGEAVLSLSGAGAERVASSLGVNFEWVPRDKEVWKPETRESGRDEYGDWFLWRYTCRAYIGSLERVAIGTAGTRNKFFGYANDQWKPLQDVNEPNIRIAAMRCAQKEGVRQLFGLRAISESAAKDLGLDMSVVRGWDFGTQGQSGKAAGAAPLQPTKPGELIELDATGIHPSRAPKFAKNKDTPWENLDERNLLWYQAAAEKNIGGTYNNGAVSDLMAVQVALVKAGHPAKYKFVDKNAAGQTSKPAAAPTASGQAQPEGGGQAKPTAPSAGNKDLKFRTISEPQEKRLFAIAGTEGGITADEMKKCLGERYPYILDESGHPNPAKLRPDHYESAVNWVRTGCQPEPPSDTNGAS